MSNDRHQSLISREVIMLTLQTRVTDILCIILFILGVVGNILGLFIFSLSRRTWRTSSSYACLATCSSIANLFCVIRYASILHSTTRHLLHELVGQTWWACKLYEFSFSFRIISTWLIIFWMFEHLIRISRRLRLVFNRWNSYKLKCLIPIIIITLILACVIGPSVYMFQPQIFEKNTKNSMMKIIIGYCQLHSNASIQWQRYFYEVHLGRNHFTIRCFFSELIPSGAIILFNSYIIYHLIETYRHLHQTSAYEPCKKQLRTASWMNAVLILHSSLFLISFFSHILGHFIAIGTHETWWILLAILVNCSLNFYIYCLSGKAFRNEIRRFIRRLKTRSFDGLQTAQHQQERSSQNRTLIYELGDLQSRLIN